jgi:hypothetical protein
MLKRILVMVMVLSLSLATTAWAHEAERDEPEELPGWMKRIHLTGTIEGDFIWAEHSDVAEEDSDSASDLFISTVELGAEVDFTDWIRGNLLFLDEDLGTGDETDVTVDEATLTLHDEKFPFFLTFGKRVQPFGVFENHLVADPMTQDAYETNRVGLTVGYSGPMDIYISATIYKGEEQMDHLFESELFDADTVTRSEGEADNEESYIVTALITPVDDLTVFGAFLSESGRGQRNNTANVGLSLVPSFVEGLRIDGEYMKALNREIYDGLAREFKEGVLSLTAAYEFVFREREVIGGAIFAERKAHIVSEPLELAVRYEHFDDDGMADELGIWSAEDRYSAGGRYAFYHDALLTAFAAVEYRHTDYRMAEANNELMTRLGITF